MARLALAGTTIIGESVGGVGTALYLKEMRLGFDAGALVPSMVAADTLFISHAHTDHIGSLASLLALRYLHHKDMATIFVPASISDHVGRLLSLWCEMAETPLDYRIFGLSAATPVPLRNNISVTPFDLQHRIQAFGFVVEESVQKLKACYLDLPAAEIRTRRADPANDLFETERRPLFTYIPDTLPEALDAAPAAAWASRILMVESSFLDDRKPLEKIRLGNHVHLDDIVARLPRFTGQHIVLFHFSQMYQPDEIPALVASRIPPEFADRVLCLV